MSGIGGPDSKDVTKWNGTAVGTPDTAGFPKVTIKAGTGTGELSLSSGAVTVGTNNDKTGYTAAPTAGSIAAASFAAAALAGQIIKSIQYGSITLSNAASNTATISSVDTAKAVLLFLGQRTAGAANMQTTTAHLALTNSTTITATRESTAAETTIINFCVMEFQ